MCGIFGCIDFEGKPLEEKRLKAINSVLARRGPDEEGNFVQQEQGVSCALVHRRLKIIDLYTGKQPMSNETENLILVCNGEIYNYKELREDLSGKGHVFKTKSDSEVILHAYEEYASDCLNYLRGMFAFALWDKKNRVLFLARDRIGKKPLYYYFEKNSKLIFSSEIRALLASGEIDRQVNRNAIREYLSYFYVPAPETIFQGIFQLKPAHYAVFSKTDFTQKKYWELDFSRKISITEGKAAQEVSRIVHESVTLRMISDVPVGIFLSGGLDSSIITGVMSQKTQLPIETFSIGFQEPALNELPFTRIIQQYFNCARNEVIMESSSFARLGELIDCFGQPHADSSALATMLLAQEAKKKITVALVGEGADELFGGYKRYLYYRFGLYLNYFKLFSDSMFMRRYKRWLGGFKENLQNEILSKDFLFAYGHRESDKELYALLSAGKKFQDIDQALFTDTKFFLPYDLLAKLDVATMAYGVEARAPFLDHKLMEFVASLPPEMKLKGMVHKYILRKAFKRMLPPEIAMRKKTGFIVPVQTWFRGPLREPLKQLLLSQPASTRGYFKHGAIEKMIKTHVEGKSNFGHELWALAVLEIWHKRFVD